MRSITSDMNCALSDNPNPLNPPTDKSNFSILESFDPHGNLKQNSMISSCSRAMGIQSNITNQSKLTAVHSANIVFDECASKKPNVKEEYPQNNTFDDFTKTQLSISKKDDTTVEKSDNHLNILNSKSALLNFFSNYKDDLKTYFILKELITNPDNKDKILNITTSNIYDLIIDKSTNNVIKTNLIEFMLSTLLNANLNAAIPLNILDKLKLLLLNHNSCLTSELYLEITDSINSVILNPSIAEVLKIRSQQILKLPEIVCDISKRSLNIITEKRRSLKIFQTSDLDKIKIDFQISLAATIQNDKNSFTKPLSRHELNVINWLMSSVDSFLPHQKIDFLDIIISEIRIYDYSACFDVSPNLAKYITLLKGIKKSVIEEKKLYQELQHHKSFKEFDEQNIWKLFINECDHKSKGKYGYEDETGYLAGCFCGFRHTLEHIRKKGPLSSDTVNVNILNEWRYHTIKNTLKVNFEPFEIDLTTIYTFALTIGKNYSKAGKEELTDTMDRKIERASRKLPSGNILYIDKHLYIHEFYRMFEAFTIEDNPKCIYARCRNNRKSVVDLKADMNTVLQIFFQELNVAKSESDKEKAILKCVVTLNRIHGFADANIRLLFFLFLNGLMISNGLSPRIWTDPNLADGYSFDESYNLLCSAKENFQENISA